MAALLLNKQTSLVFLFFLLLLAFGHCGRVLIFRLLLEEFLKIPAAQQSVFESGFLNPCSELEYI